MIDIIDFLYQILFVNFSDCFIWKTECFSYIVNETFKEEFSEHKKLVRHESSGDYYFIPFFTAKDLMLVDSLSSNSITILVFLGSAQALIFSSTFLNFLFLAFLFFSNESTPSNLSSIWFS